MKWLSYKFILPILSPTYSSSGRFLSTEEGEILGEVCILDDIRSTKQLRALANFPNVMVLV